MTDKEAAVARYRSYVREAEAKLRRARQECELGYRASMATLEKARVDHEKEYTRLKHEVLEAETYLERERIALAAAEAELGRGFEA